MQDIEFKVGDKVTYKPYHLWRTMYVAEVITKRKCVDGTIDDRVHYKLSSKVGLPPVVLSTGLCLIESKYFESSAWRVVIPGQEDNPDFINITQADAEMVQNHYAERGQMVILNEENSPVH